MKLFNARNLLQNNRGRRCGADKEIDVEEIRK